MAVNLPRGSSKRLDLMWSADLEFDGNERKPPTRSDQRLSDAKYPRWIVAIGAIAFCSAFWFGLAMLIKSLVGRA